MWKMYPKNKLPKTQHNVSVTFNAILLPRDFFVQLLGVGVLHEKIKLTFNSSHQVIFSVFVKTFPQCKMNVIFKINVVKRIH